MEDRPIYRDGEEITLVANLELGGRKYKLQHPGVAKWLEWKGKMFTILHDGKKIHTKQDTTAILILFLEHCVICVSEPEFKLTIDNMHIGNAEAWDEISLTFLTGKYQEKPIGSDNGSGGNNPVGPVAENEVAGNSGRRGKKK